MTGGPNWWEIGADDVVAIDLPDDQRELMIHGLLQWGGPAYATDRSRARSGSPAWTRSIVMARASDLRCVSVNR